VSLLAPLFLLGVLAVALPVWLHRLQTQSSERKPFSSAMLLETADQQVHVKKKLKYLLLLAARIVLLVLLALAFAKPFIAAPPVAITANESGTHLVVVDTSASMGRTGISEQMRAEANRALDDAPADALLQVVTADTAVRLLTPLTDDSSVARSALASVAPSALRLDYGEAISALERLVTSLPPPVTLHFVSDFQATAMPARFAEVIPAGFAEFVPHVVGTGEPFNWSVDFVRETPGGLDAGISGTGDRERIADVDLIINDTVVESRGLNQAGSQVLHFDSLVYAGGENRVVLRINTDDDLLADNNWYHVVDNDPPAAVPLLTLNTGGLPVTYLSAALESAGNYRVEPMMIGDFDPRILSRYRWLMLDEIGFIDQQLERALTEFLQNGGNLLAFAGDRAASLESLPVSGHRLAASRIEAQAGAFRSVGQIDDRHPVLSATEGWQNVHVSRNLPLDTLEGDDVLIRLENNEPFLIERRVGQGRILLLTGSLDNRWNDLPVRPVFVSFMIEAAMYLSGVNEIPKTYTVGSSLPLALAGSSSGQVVDPDGNSVLSLADTRREQQIKLNKPGFYEVYTSQGETLVAANVDPLESDLRKINQEVLDRWRDATGGPAQPGTTAFSAEASGTLDLWPWILLALAIVVIGESILGNMHLTLRRTERA
jgi:hypothetical protein